MLLNIFLGSLGLSVVHFLIPNHWMPIVVMARSEGWDKGRSLRLAAHILQEYEEYYDSRHNYLKN